MCTTLSVEGDFLGAMYEEGALFCNYFYFFFFNYKLHSLQLRHERGAVKQCLVILAVYMANEKT